MKKWDTNHFLILPEFCHEFKNSCSSWESRSLRLWRGVIRKTKHPDIVSFNIKPANSPFKSAVSKTRLDILTCLNSFLCRGDEMLVLASYIMREEQLSTKLNGILLPLWGSVTFLTCTIILIKIYKHFRGWQIHVVFDVCFHSQFICRLFSWKSKLIAIPSWMISWSPKWRLQITCFVRTTGKKQKYSLHRHVRQRKAANSDN